MTAPESPITRIPIICVDQSTWESTKVFNPNSWSGDSKGIAQSCWVELSVLRHCIVQIHALCTDRKTQCSSQIANIQKQYKSAQFPIEKSIVFAEKPELHMRIEAFFSGVKSLLDLMVQLLTTENIVSVAVHGFHRTKNVYGGSVINALQNNATKNHKELAKNIEKLIAQHKNQWIDQVVRARDDLIHPRKGMFQLMFQMDFEENNGDLICTQVKSPTVNSAPIDQYTARTLQQITEFATAFIVLLQKPASG